MIPRPANRIDTIGDSWLAAKVAEADYMRTHGIEVIPLGVGSPDKPPHSLVAETMCEHTYREDVHGYQPLDALPELHKAFAQWYRTWYGVELDSDGEIATTDGAKEGIRLVNLTFLNPGDKVLVPNPGYQAYGNLARMIGVDVVEYTLTQEGGWHPDIDALEQTDLTGVKLMWINYPNMPTGVRASHKVLERLVDFCRRHGIVLANDCSLAMVCNEHPLSLLSVKGAKEAGCIEINSLSASHNMAGWRMGMVGADAEVIEWVRRIKGSLDAGRFRPMVKAATRALQLPRRWYTDLNSMYQRRFKIGREVLEALGCTYDPSIPPGLYLWGKLPDDVPSAREFCERLLHEKHILIMPGDIFGSEGSRYVRLAMCCPHTRMKRAILLIKGLPIHPEPKAQPRVKAHPRFNAPTPPQRRHRRGGRRARKN